MDVRGQALMEGCGLTNDPVLPFLHKNQHVYLTFPGDEFAFLLSFSCITHYNECSLGLRHPASFPPLLQVAHTQY